MQDIYYPEIDQYSLIMNETSVGITLVSKKVSPLYVFEYKRCYKRIPIFYKNKVYFFDAFSGRTYFWDTAVPCGSKNSPNVVQLYPDEDKYYLLTPYPTFMPPPKKFSPESIRAIARNPNVDLHVVFYIRHTTPHTYTTISGTTYKDGHYTTTINRSKLTKTCRNSRIFRHLRTRLQRIF